MFDDGQDDIMKMLKKINKGLKTEHKKNMKILDAGHNECMGMLEASKNELVGKPNASKNEPVGEQTTLDDIKDILLSIEQFLKSEKGQARIHELHKSRQAMARPEPIF